MTQSATVRSMELSDVEPMLDYFLGLDEPTLRGMGVEPSKLPNRKEWHDLLTEDFGKRLDKRQFYYTAWELDGRIIGHSNVNKLQYGDSAFAHLHVWEPELRRDNIGTQCFSKSIKLFFQQLRLETLYCEPNAINEAPNRTLARAGFDFVETYETTPGWINFHQPVSRWRLERANVMQKPKTRIETERLVLREFELSDADDVFKFATNAEVTRFTGDAGHVQTMDDVERVIVETWHHDYREHGYGRLAVVDRESDKVIGFCGLKYLDDLKFTDIGYRFLPEYWGRGIATEAAEAVMKYGAEELKLTDIHGMVLPENAASRRVLEKIGLKHSDTISLEEAVEVCVYR